MRSAGVVPPSIDGAPTPRGQTLKILSCFPQIHFHPAAEVSPVQVPASIGKVNIRSPHPTSCGYPAKKLAVNGLAVARFRVS